VTASRVRIKFCGITRSEDAIAAAELGVDAIGMVFTRRSKRFVEIAQAYSIRAALSPLVGIVALLMDDAPEWVAEIIETVQPDLLQFHGSESADYCEQFGARYIKAVPMGSVEDVAAFAAQHPLAQGFLLDSHAYGTTGGSGERFDWQRVPRDFDRPLILAGGLHAGNVAEAVRTVRPHAVDVSSGIESAPGMKDLPKMQRFVDAVRSAENDLRQSGARSFSFEFAQGRT
jgi:phosphoribosylanthranilate isomerase